MSTVILIILVLLPIVAMWMIFEKAGKPGWAAIIPIYNFITLLRVAGKSGWWILLFIIPIINIVFYIMMLHGVSQNFGKGAGFTVGLFFLPIIFYPILAFSDAKYQPVTPASI